VQPKQTIFKVNTTKFSLGDQYLKILLAQCTWAGRRCKKRVLKVARDNILSATSFTLNNKISYRELGAG